MLPTAFVEGLAGHEELIVSSREDGRERSVRAWYVLAPSGSLYLFTYAFAIRARRWRSDPWVRLTIPGLDVSVEGVVEEVTADELDDELSPLIQERWWMWGATNSEGLRRMLRDRSHVLFQVKLP